MTEFSHWLRLQEHKGTYLWLDVQEALGRIRGVLPARLGRWGIVPLVVRSSVTKTCYHIRAAASFTGASPDS